MMSLDTLSAQAKVEGFDPELYFEIVEGRRVALQRKPMAILPAAMLLPLIYRQTMAQFPGVVVFKPLIRFDAKESRRPDLAFYSMEELMKDSYRMQRLHLQTKRKKPIETSLIPMIAVETIGPETTCGFIAERTDRFFKAGVRTVWHIYCVNKRIHVLDGPTNISIYGMDDEVEGCSEIPDLVFKVSEVFAVKLDKNAEGEASQ